MRIYFSGFHRLFLLLTVAVAGIACTRTDPEEQEVNFVVACAPFTKGAEFDGSSLTENARLLITATMRDTDGNITAPSVFTSNGSPAFGRLIKDGDVWKASGAPLQLPFGGYTLDVVAFGTDSDAGEDESSFGTDAWTPVIDASDAASTVSFTVDTYEHQKDLMFGTANGISGPTANLSLRHALALLVFNVKFTGDAMAFIENNTGGNYKFKIDDILFVNNAGLTQYLASTPVSQKNILLKTSGTFSIDNTRNKMSWAWTGLSAVAGEYSLKMNTAPDAPTLSNTDAENVVFSNEESSWKRSIQRDKLYQLGHPLLVPQQPIQSVKVVYTFEGNTYAASVNLPGGYWFSGERYIYNLVVDHVGPEAPHHWIY